MSFNACALHVFVCEELQLPAGVRHDGEHQRSRGCWQVADVWQVGVRFFSFSHPKNIFAILHLKLVQVHKHSYLRKLLYAYICFLRWDSVISYQLSWLFWSSLSSFDYNLSCFMTVSIERKQSSEDMTSMTIDASLLNFYIFGYTCIP